MMGFEGYTAAMFETRLALVEEARRRGIKVSRCTLQSLASRCMRGTALRRRTR
jgi:hypothetical protein